MRQEIIEAVIGHGSCPKCGVEKDQRCVYLMGLYPASANSYRAGQPTLHPHPERVALWREYQKRKDARERRIRLIAANRLVPAEVQTLLDIRQAQMTFERMESAKVAAWLHRHGSILWESA